MGLFIGERSTVIVQNVITDPQSELTCLNRATLVDLPSSAEGVCATDRLQ